MKTHHALLSLLTAILFVTSVLPAFAGEAKVGDSVAAMWKDGNYWVGTVTGISDDQANILYEDGDKLAVPLAKVHPLSQAATFKVGDHVIAAWKGAQMFPGVITAVSDLSCTVKWDDGDAPLEVKKARIFLSPK